MLRQRLNSPRFMKIATVFTLVCRFRLLHALARSFYGIFSEAHYARTRHKRPNRLVPNKDYQVKFRLSRCLMLSGPFASAEHELR